MVDELTLLCTCRMLKPNEGRHGCYRPPPNTEMEDTQLLVPCPCNDTSKPKLQAAFGSLASPGESGINALNGTSAKLCDPPSRSSDWD